MSASGWVEGAGVTSRGNEGSKTALSSREQWKFSGRETHWGYTYLVWTRDDGARWAKVQL